MATDETIYSIEAESAVIGAVIINPDLFTELALPAEDFYVHRNQEIWTAARELHEAGQAVDYLTLTEQLTRKNKLAEIGGQAYLMGLITRTPTSLHAGAYAGIVRDKARRRRVLQIANTLAQAAWSEQQNLDEITPAVIEQLAGTAQVQKGAVPIREYLSALYDQVVERAENPVDVWGIPTGIGKYDYMTGGLQKTELEILSGMSGVGKSMLAVQRAAKMAEHSPGAIYSLEMSGLALVRRLVSGESNIRTRALKTGRIKDDEWPFFTNAIDKLSALPVYISEHTGWTTMQLHADLARLKATEGIGWFLIDYLYLLADGDGMKETEKTTMISRNLKRICADLKLAGTAVHSMNKAGFESNDESGEKKGRNGLPENRDLRGSGQITFDADLICFLTHYKDGQLSEVIPARDQKNLRVMWITKGRELEDAQKYVLLVQRPGYPAFAEYAPEAR